MSLKKIDGNIKRIVTNAAKLNELIHETAVLIVQHAFEHGDCTRAAVLFKALPASMRRSMYILWLNTFTPIRYNESSDKVGILPKTSKKYVDWDIETAKATPFYELAEKNPEKVYDFATLVKLVERLGKQIEKKIEDGKVPAEDVESAKAIAVKVSALRFDRVLPAAANTNEVTEQAVA